MGKLIGFTEVLLRGLLASYLLLFAFEIHKHPQRLTPIITNNLQLYSQLVGHGVGFSSAQLVERHLLHYCQFLVIMSLAVVCGMRFGKAFGWVTVLINLLLTSNQTEPLFFGIHLIFIALIA